MAPSDTATANRAEPRFERRTVDGHELRIAVWAGLSSGKPPLLLFNGIGSRIELLAPFVDRLDAEREILAVDIPGTGESPATQFPYRLWMLARLIGRLLEQLKVERVDLLGVSWGGTLAQQFALQNPRRCRRLVLAATGAGGLMIPGKLSVLAKMATPRRFKDPNFMRDNMGELYGGMARTEPELLADFARLSRSPSRRGYLYQQMALAGWVSAPLLPLLRQPTLILAGDDDPLAPVANAHVMAKLIPHSTLTVLEDGHLFLFTKARECADLVDRFLDSNDK